MKAILHTRYGPPDRLELNDIADLVAAGKLRLVVDRRFPLERIADAFAHVEQGHKKGNVVITVAHS